MTWKKENVPLDYFKHIQQEGFMDVLFICESQLNVKIPNHHITYLIKYGNCYHIVF